MISTSTVPSLPLLSPTLSTPNALSNSYPAHRAPLPATATPAKRTSPASSTIARPVDSTSTHVARSSPWCSMTVKWSCTCIGRLAHRVIGVGGRGGVGVTGRIARNTTCMLLVWRRCWWSIGMRYILRVVGVGEEEGARGSWRLEFLVWEVHFRPLIIGIGAKGSVVRWLLWLSSLLYQLFLVTLLPSLLGLLDHWCLCSAVPLQYVN